MFIQFLIAVISFLLAITLLVAVHEYGHFWVARKLGVKVLRFSIGFGKPLWKRTPENGETEFVVSALPIGGYVKMLDERSEENIATEDLSRAFNRQPVWKRILILLAGPAANFIFAIGLFYLLFLYGVQTYKPYLMPVDESSLAYAAGLQAGDEVISINGQVVNSYEDLILRLVDGVISENKIQLLVKRGSLTEQVILPVDSEVAKLDDPGTLLQGLGIRPWQPDYFPQIAGLVSKSPAEISGLQIGDLIQNVDSVPVDNVQSFISYIQARPNQSVSVVVNRNNKLLTLQVHLSEKLINSENIGIIGASLRVPQDIIDKMRVRQRFGLLSGLKKACVSTYDMSALSLKMFREMVLGKVSLKNLSGPISIAQQASYSAQSGLDQFIKFLALISIALGIVNLLPVPMLDGGQIVFNIMELVKGSPVSLRIEMIFQQLGIICIFLIMGLAIYNDIERLF